MTKEIKYSYAPALLVILSDVSHTINFSLKQLIIQQTFLQIYVPQWLFIR